MENVNNLNISIFGLILEIHLNLIEWIFVTLGKINKSVCIHIFDKAFFRLTFHSFFTVAGRLIEEIQIYLLPQHLKSVFCSTLNTSKSDKPLWYSTFHFMTKHDL